MFRQLKITYRFVAATGIAVVVVFAMIFVLAKQGAVTVLDQLEMSELEGIASNVVNEIEADAYRAQSMAAVVASMPQVRQAFATRDREALIDYFANGFAGLKSNYGVAQFQFHEPPARSFLRLHKLEKSGDDLSSFRHTVVESNGARKGIRGLEVGVAGLGIRGIVPIAHDGSHAGTVEFGLSLGKSFIDRVAAAYGVDVAVHVRRGQRFELLASSRAEGELATPETLATITSDAILFEKTRLAGTPVAVLGRPLLDYSGKPIGVILVAKDRSAFQAQLTQITTEVSLLALVSALALLGLVWLIASSVVKPLRKAQQNMEAIAYGSGDLTDRLDDSGKDEISALAKAYNAFVGKLEGTINTVVSTTNELAAMVGGFSEVSERTSEGTRRQQQQVVQVATAMTEMSATVHEVAQNTVNTAEAARQVDQQSNSGQEVVRTAMESINRLADAVGTAVERIRLVEQDSQRIGSVLDVIRGIAEQTNLLALNAAIEAARAGEQGRGFAVVADEVRTLAQRTQQSTREIQEMIESLQGGVENTVGVLEQSKHQATESVSQSAKAHEALVAINQSIDAITTMSAQIATAAEEQSAVAEDINRSIVDITQVAEATSIDAQRSVRETDHLASAVDQLVGIMGQFRTGNQHANELSRAK
jgi:methyl-accepting chemotaxis protein